MNSDAIIRPAATSTQASFERTTLDTTLSIPIRFAASAVRPTPRSPASPAPMRRATRLRCRPRRSGTGSSDGGAAAGAADRRPGGVDLWRRQARHRSRGLRDPLRALVDLVHAVGDPGPGVALCADERAARPIAASRWARGGAPAAPREALRIGQGHEDAVDAVGDTTSA